MNGVLSCLDNKACSFVYIHPNTTSSIQTCTWLHAYNNAYNVVQLHCLGQLSLFMDRPFLPSILFLSNMFLKCQTLFSYFNIVLLPAQYVSFLCMMKYITFPSQIGFGNLACLSAVLGAEASWVNCVKHLPCHAAALLSFLFFFFENSPRSKLMTLTYHRIPVSSDCGVPTETFSV